MAVNSLQNNWDDQLNDVQLLHNSYTNLTTGYSPLDLMTGRKLEYSYEVDGTIKSVVDQVNLKMGKAKHNQEKTNMRNKRNYDVGKVDLLYRIGEVVLVKDVASLKLQSRKFGIGWTRATVLDKINFKVYEVKLLNSNKILKINENKMRKLNKNISKETEIKEKIEKDECYTISWGNNDFSGRYSQKSFQVAKAFYFVVRFTSTLCGMQSIFKLQNALHSKTAESKAF